MGMEKDPRGVDCLTARGVGCHHHCLFFKEDSGGSVLLKGLFLKSQNLNPGVQRCKGQARTG